MFSKTRTVLVTSAAIVAIAVFTAPLDAQRSRDERGGRAESPRGGPRAGAPQPRAGQSVQSQTPTRPDRGPSSQGPSGWSGYQGARPGPPPAPMAPRAQAVPGPGAAPRPYDSRSYDARGNSPRYQYNDRYQAPRYVAPRAAPYGDYRGYGRAYVVRPPVFTQRYYTFHPRFVLGFGLSVGFGFAYPFQYYDPYAFYNYRVGVGPGYGVGSYYSRVGGLSFDIDPYDAAVFVDGGYVGRAEDFGPAQMPLTLAVGRHHIDLQADGFLAASFDITIVGGQVIPYQGSLALR
jgi:hypothetical protein